MVASPGAFAHLARATWETAFFSSCNLKKYIDEYWCEYVCVFALSMNGLVRSSSGVKCVEGRVVGSEGTGLSGFS